MLTSTYMPNIERLSAVEKLVYNSDRIPGTVTLSDFRSSVHQALTDYYGASRVHPRNKCIKVDKGSDTVDADVVPAYQYRLFTSYPRYGEATYIEGIQIRPLKGSPILNYPKEHIRNGQTKNKACNEYYKPAVRQVKHLSNHAAPQGKFPKGTVPGYALECMVYNLSSQLFVPDDHNRLIKVMAALSSLSAEQYVPFWSCDEIHHLFRDDPGEHNEYTAKRVIDLMWECCSRNARVHDE